MHTNMTGGEHDRPRINSQASIPYAGNTPEFLVQSPAQPTEVSDYTPTTAEVRDVALLGAIDAAGGEQNLDIDEFLAMFDRWLAKHDADRLAVVEAELAAALATIEAIASEVEPRAFLGGTFDTSTAMVVRNILAAHPTAALAEHDARVLDKAADALVDHWPYVGDDLVITGPATAIQWLRARAAQYRAQGDGTSHDEQTGDVS